MAQLLDIQRIAIGSDALRATVRVAEGAPLRTSESVEGTARVYWLMPAIADHRCLGEGGEVFRDVMGDTDIAHLMEHVTLELLSRTNIAGDISCGRTRDLEAPRTFEIALDCPDDVLVTSALSSAAWILQWAFGSADEAAKPNVDAIVAGIMNLTAHAYDMEGNEAPKPGAQPLVPAEMATAEAAGEADEALEEAALAEVEDVLARDALEAAELDRDAELEADLAEDFEEDALARFDLDLGGADEAVEAVTEPGAARPVITEVGGDVGFMGLAGEDPLAEG